LALRAVQSQLQIILSKDTAMALESADKLGATARRAIGSTGRRMTQQRAVLLEIIQESSDHLDAEEIYRRARERGEKLSLSTVYRTLDLLKRLDLVDELHLWDGHHHYESKTPQEHSHLVCRECGGVIELSWSVVERIKALAARQEEFQIERAQVDFIGLCAACSEASSRN
jgi:Fur family transcriptional regulator, ferric uptake regulator